MRVRDVTASVAAEAAAGRIRAPAAAPHRTRRSTPSLSADDAGAVVAWNPAATRMFGMGRGGAGQPPGSAICSPTRRARTPRGEDLAGSTVQAGGRRADGSTFEAEVAITSLPGRGACLAHGLRARRHRADARPRHSPSSTRAGTGSWWSGCPGWSTGHRSAAGHPMDYVSPQLETLLGFHPDDWIGDPGRPGAADPPRRPGAGPRGGRRDRPPGCGPRDSARTASTGCSPATVARSGSATTRSSSATGDGRPVSWNGFLDRHHRAQAAGGRAPPPRVPRPARPGSRTGPSSPTASPTPWPAPSASPGWSACS